MTTRDFTAQHSLFGNFRRKAVRAERAQAVAPSAHSTARAEVESAVTLELLVKLVETLTSRQGINTPQKESAAPCAMQEVSPYLVDRKVDVRIQRMIHDIVDEKIQELILTGRVNLADVEASAPSATTHDPLAAARARGAAHMTAELERPDNLSLDAAADYSRLSGRHINQLRNEGKLYALVREGTTRGFRYPRWQFDADRSRLEAVLRTLHAHKLTCWAMHTFLTRPNEHLGQAPRDSILDPDVPLENILQAVDRRFGGADQGAS